MANTYKNIVITPNTGSSTGDPTIVFSGGDTVTNTDISLRVYPTTNGTLSFEGSAGQLFSITNDLTNTIFSVADISGIPLIEVNVNSQQITFGQFYGNVGIGTANAIYKLDCNGAANIVSPTLLVAGSNVLASFASGNNYAGAMANSGNVFSGLVYAAVNSAFAVINAAYTSSNADYVVSNAAFAAANAKVATVSGTAGRVTSSGTTAITLDLATAGAGAATYSSGISAVTVDAYGRVTSVTGSASYATTTTVATNATSANNYAGAMANSANAYAATVGTSANAYSNATFPTKTGTGASGLWPISVTGYANSVNSNDGDRNAATVTPSTTTLRVRYDFTSASSANTGGNYAGVMTYAPWLGTTASTGDASYQIAFGSSATNGAGIPWLNVRKGIDSVWNNWFTLFHTGNFTVTTASAARITTSTTTGSGNTSVTLDLATAGAGAATYSSGISAITVDAYGRVTSVTGSASYATTTTVATNATSANNYAGAMANSGNAYAATVGTSANAYATAVGAAGNAYAVTVGTSTNNYTSATYAPKASPTFTGTVTHPVVFMNRLGGASVGINWYSTGYTAWQNYMGPAGVSQGYSGTVTAPTGTYVTSWALRSFIENAAGYGWTWESGSSTSTTPALVAELSSATGNFKTIGDVTVSSNTTIGSNGNVNFAQANPVIRASSYLQMPGGLYVSGGTLYAQNQAQFRGGIRNDTGAYLQIDGGTANYTYVPGNVSIGITGSNNKLTVYSTNSSDDDNLIVLGFAGFTPYASIGTHNVDGTTGGMKFSTKLSGTLAERMRIDASGNVGIGNTAPFLKLEVAGNMSVDNFIEYSATIATNYTITTGRNALTAGPVTINSGVTVTVPSGSTWTIV